MNIWLATHLNAAMIGTENYFHRNFNLTDNSRWIKRNETELRERLKENIYGQPFATRILLNAVGNRWSDPEQQYDKPLVMMLHGPTGVGKNYITRTLANSMYTQGTNSVFIHYMTSAVHFTSDDSIKTHISELQNWIEGDFD
jgi:predicted alpha/beta-fold hydrolase